MMNAELYGLISHFRSCNFLKISYKYSYDYMYSYSYSYNYGINTTIGYKF